MKPHKLYNLFIICTLLITISSCNNQLIFLEGTILPFEGSADSNINLTQGEEQDSRVYMASIAGLARSDISSMTWVGPETPNWIIWPQAILHERRTNDLFPTLVAWRVGNDIKLTFGNNIRRLQSPGFTLNATTDWNPQLFAYDDKDYLLWWDNLELKLAEYLGQGNLSPHRIIYTRPQSQSLGGEFQPTVTILNNEIFVLTQLGARDQGPRRLHLSRSSDLINWTQSFINVDRDISPRPEIIAYENRLYLFYHSFIPNNTVNYLHSENGIDWSEELELVVLDQTFEPSGKVGVLGGIGVARHFEHLVVSWVSDQNSTTQSIYVASFE